MAKRRAVPMERDVSAVFDSAPEAIRSELIALRDLIFEVALAEAVGEVTETLKWGQPAYLTLASKAGTTIRMGWKPSDPDGYALYVHCQTRLIDEFRTRFPELDYEGNRAILFRIGVPWPVPEVSECIAAALTYHRRKKSKTPKTHKRGVAA